MAARTVWLFQVHHRHGDDVSVYSTKQKAVDGVYEWVAEYWDDEMIRQYNDVPQIPSDRQEAIDLYFNSIDDEWYECFEKEIL